jgi:hypothetical protein
LNELTRYEHEVAKQLSNLPVPDENMAWGEMRKLLDEEKDDGPVVPFWLRGGCLWWGIGLLLIVSVAGWYFFGNKKQDATVKHQQTAAQLQPEAKKDIDKNERTGVTVMDTFRQNNDTKPGDAITYKNMLQEQQTTGKSTMVVSDAKSNIYIKNGSTEMDETAHSTVAAKQEQGRVGKNKRQVKQDLRQKTTIKQPVIETDIPETTNIESVLPGTALTSATTNKTDTLSEIKKEENKTIIAKLPTTDSSAKAKDKPDKPSKKYFFSSGVAVFQPFAINGESAVPFNRNGRKGSLTDYIPSVYIRLTRDKKWFLQSEFRYGVPQSSKQFVYRKEKIDTSTTASYILKKTYYHQLPVSFNYYVLPGLSVGTGIIYSEFATAIAQQDIVNKRPFTGIDSLISSGVVRDRMDSNFTRHNFQWLAEVQYQWRRFSFGARYSQDLKPFIHYSDQTTGLPLSKKNASFNVFVRYELWKQRKK